MIDGFEAQAVITSKAYDCNVLRQIIADRGAEAVPIRSNRSRKAIIPRSVLGQVSIDLGDGGTGTIV